MSHLTPIGSRLSASLSDEYLRMQNEWFFKWHFISEGRTVEIDSFRGKPICYGGIRFSGSAADVYWDTIQHYLRKKIDAMLNATEEELKGYSLEIKDKALTEAKQIITQFAGRIRQAAVEKDRILRGDGIRFPPPHDRGRWHGCGPVDIEARVQGLRRIYCDLTLNVGGINMSFGAIPKEPVTLTKKDGTIVRSDIPAVVSDRQIRTFVTDLQIEVGDHILRQLPNGLVEDYIVDEPCYNNGIGPIPANYAVKVHRSDAPTASPPTVIANFHGANSRMNVNSTDNSSNRVVYQTHDLAQLADELSRLREALLTRARSAEHYAAIGVIASAELQAKSGEQPKISALGAAGRWVLEAAKNIGAKIATEVVKDQVGL
jgi:hypothetical protein